MPGAPDDFDSLLAQVADGQPVDWEAFERAAADDVTLALVRELRLVAELAEVHRSQVDDAPSTDPAAGSVGQAGADEPPPHRDRRARSQTVPDRPLSGDDRRWGHLLLVRKIGEGAFGEVYHAHDTWLDHPVALKLLKVRHGKSVDPLHEARKLARIRHPNVVTVHGADRRNGQVGFWMDLVDGETLEARVETGLLSAGEARVMGQEVCRALAAVHRANIIHRDVKAQNVMRAHDGGRIILMDFGAGEFLDAASEDGPRQGTVLYLAPELFEGQAASVRSDVYAAGVLLYHLVTRRYPVEAASVEELRKAHQRGRRRRLRDDRPDLPDWFITVVERATHPDAARRFASAGEMEAALDAGPVPSPAPEPLSFVTQAAIAFAGLLALAGMLGFIAARSFEGFLHIEPAFSLGARDILRIGFEALTPFIGLWVAFAAVLGGVLALRSLLPSAWRQRLDVMRMLDGMNPAVLATLLLILGVGVGSMVSWHHWLVMSTLFELSADSGIPASALSLLTPASRPLHILYGNCAAALVFGLILVVWQWLPRLEARTDDKATVRVVRWGLLAVAFLVMVPPAAMRRPVWERFAKASFGNQSGVVIANTGTEYLLYAPDEPGRPRMRVRADAPGLQISGETRILFDFGR